MKLKRLFVKAMVLTVILFSATFAWAAPPKYVFFFLGDGMSASQIQATEAYLTTLNGGSARKAADLRKPENKLNMSKMPVMGMQTTYDAHALITDSASAGTAFACGIKTLSGIIGMDENKTIRYKSIAQLAHASGKKVGILSSVSLDHATPAAYYANVPNRGLMNSIATQLVESGYEFFGGGGLVRPTGAPAPDTDNNIWNLLSHAGYEVRNTREAILSLKEKPKDRVVCINPRLPDSSAMPYDIDRLHAENTNLSLSEITEVAISNLYGNPRKAKGKHKGRKADGFFIMVEGGKIDWACHAHDAMAAIGDILDFDDAVGVALNFYKTHPHETLIIVTGDHETGGMTIGHATTAYGAYYERLLNQSVSFQYFTDNQWPAHLKVWKASVCANVAASDNLATNPEMLAFMHDLFGLKWADLNAYQKEKLEDAYDQSLCGVNKNSDSENTFLYGGYEPIVVTITHILNERAGIGWTSYSHTGLPVPVFAQGRGAASFSGLYDNTDIAKKLAKVMNLGNLPVVE